MLCAAYQRALNLRPGKMTYASNLQHLADAAQRRSAGETDTTPRRLGATPDAHDLLESMVQQ